MSPAYQAALQASNNYGKFQQRMNDQGKDDNDLSALDKILAQTAGTENYDMAINQILSNVSPKNQQNAIAVIQNRQKAASDQMMAQQKAYKEQATREADIRAGVDPDLSQSLKKSSYENVQSEKRASSIFGAKKDEANKDFQSLDDAQLVELSGVKGYSEQAKQELIRRETNKKLDQRISAEDRKFDQKERSEERKFDRAISADLIKETNTDSKEIERLESSLALMEQAIVGKDLSFFSPDSLAELTGVEALRSPEGALFKTAAKDFFLGSLKESGARPNQFLEKQIVEMLPKIGRSTEANLTVSRAFKNEIDLKKERIRLTRDLLADPNNKARDIGKMVSKSMNSYANNKQKEVYNDMKAISAIANKSNVDLKKVESGTEISKYVVQSLLLKNKNDPKKAEQEAKNLGYKF